MSVTRRWMWLGLTVSGLCLGCGQESMGGGEPSASEREGRSEVLRGLMASKEQAPDPEALKGPSDEETVAITPGAAGQGGSGRPGSTKQVQGRVTWVGDNELLIRVPGGVERDLEVNPATRLLERGAPVTLRRLAEGDEVRVSYEEGPGGWVARQVELLPAPDASPPLKPIPRPGQGRSGQGEPMAPPR